MRKIYCIANSSRILHTKDWWNGLYIEERCFSNSGLGGGAGNAERREGGLATGERKGQKGGKLGKSVSFASLFVSRLRPYS